MGSLILLFSLSACSSSESLSSSAETDVFKWDNNVIQDLGQTEISTIGGLISEDSSFNIINNFQTVVLLSSTNYGDSGTIFTYSDPGALAGNVTFDTEDIGKIRSGDFLKDLGGVPEKSFWNRTSTLNITKKFPSAKLIFISINEKTDNSRLQQLAYVLKNTLPENSAVFAVANIEKTVLNENPLISEFQSHFINSAVSSLDIKSLNGLPEDSAAQMKALAYYSIYRKSGGPEMQNGGGEHHNFILKQGTNTQEKDNTVYFVYFGDMMLGRYVRTLMDANGLDYPFTKMDQSYLRMKNLLVANLEGPIAKNAISTSKTIAFRFMPDIAPLLQKYYVDMVSLANNHALDMGINGFTDSREILDKQGILHFGDPRGITDDSIQKTIIKGQKFAFIGLEEVVYKIDENKTIEAIKSLANEGYRVIVMPHWGIEYTHKPNNRQIDLAHKFIDAGAFAIIGGHPHVVQSYETYKGHPVFYSLGNAIFDQYWSIDTQKGLSVAMEVDDKEVTIYFIPLDIDRSRPTIMDEEKRKQFMQEFVTYGQFTDEEKNAILEGKLYVKLPL